MMEIGMAMENNEAPLYKADDRYQGYLDQEQVRLAEATRTGKLNEYYGFVGDFDTLKTNNLGDIELRDCFYASSDNEAPLFHIELYKDRYVSYFYSQSNEFQDQERTRLTQKFVSNIAEGKKPYDGLTRNDLILFFISKVKGTLTLDNLLRQIKPWLKCCLCCRRRRIEAAGKYFRE